MTPTWQPEFVQLSTKIGATCAKVTGPLAQLHTPFTHALPAPQTLPQPPQLSVELAVSTQVVPHKVLPASHMQLPAEQVVPDGHTFPQPPQLSALLLVSMHEPLQSVPPLGQAQCPA
jgi:hypothetical protein